MASNHEEPQQHQCIQHRAYARVGLLGNPSDAYFGNTLSFAISNFWASVTLHPSDLLVIHPHPRHDPMHFDSLQQLAKRVHDEGYYGGIRLLMAICKIFHQYCLAHDITLHAGNFSLSYDTNIPRQAGLSGSSAIVCAALNCMLEFYKVSHLVKVEDRPTIILSAEEEIGVTAGLQDRVVQVYGGLVYMDFDKDYMDSRGHGIYTPMDPDFLPELYIIYAENPSDSGKVHSSVRKRWLDGDDVIRSWMKEVADLAVQGRSALESHNYSTLAELMNKNFELRRLMFGDDALGEMNIKMVEVAHSVGAAAKFTGSGGAAVALCLKGPSQIKQLEEACKVAGFILQQAHVAPALITNS